MLLRWLPTDAPCPVPAFATHIVGCGGLVINPKGEVLCVREKNPLRKTGWKLPGGITNCRRRPSTPPAWPRQPPIDRPGPGPPRRTRPCLPPPSRLGQLRVCPPPAVAERAGLMELGEEVGEATAREVFEETGVRAAFASLLTMRVQHGAAFGRDDFYFVSAMTALSEEIRLDGCEISECRWLPLAEYRADTEATAAERGIGDTMNSWLMRNVEASLNAGSPPAEWGWKAFELDAGAAQSSANVTGWGNRPTYHIFGPPSFQPGRPMPDD